MCGKLIDDLEYSMLRMKKPFSKNVSGAVFLSESTSLYRTISAN